MTRLRWVSATLLLAIPFALLGCGQGKQIPAIGPGSEIIVLSAGKSRDIGTMVADILSREILLVQPEVTFMVEDDGNYWTEIPHLERRGSSGKKLSLKEVTQLLQHLPRSLGQLEDQLNLEFEAW